MALFCDISQNESARFIDWCTFNVVAFKKKVVLFLVMVALGGGVLAVCCAQTTVSESSKELFGNSGGLFASEPNFSVGSDESFNTRELFFRMMLSVLFVVVLGIALVYVLKRFGGRITGLPGKRIRVVETVALGPRRTVHLVEVGDRRLLIGSTNENITMLADVTDALSNLSNRQTDTD